MQFRRATYSVMILASEQAFFAIHGVANTIASPMEIPVKNESRPKDFT